MTTVYIIRHAESEGNYYRRAVGVTDCNLTDVGYRQLPYLAKRFETIQLDAIYSSDLKRAQETARAVADQKKMPVILEPQLREINAGIWEDQPWGNVAWEDPDGLRRYNNDPLHWSVPGAEAAIVNQVRLMNVVRRLASYHDGETIALFTHGGATRLLLAAIRGTPSEEIRWSEKSGNTGVTLLNVDGENITIEYEGDNSHLPDTLSQLAKQSFWDTKKIINPRLRPWDPQKEQKLYSELYKSGWQAAHSGACFDPAPYLYRAAAKSAKDPTLIMVALAEDTPIGLVEFNDERDAEKGAGHISFYAMTEAFRGKRLSPILMGEAISRYRRLGRSKLQLTVSPENKNAIGYYMRMGFQKTGETDGAYGKIDVMEKDIRL